MDGALRLRWFYFFAMFGLSAGGLWVWSAYLADNFSGNHHARKIPFAWIVAVVGGTSQFAKSRLTKKVIPLLVNEHEGWTFARKVGNRDSKRLAAEGLLPARSQVSASNLVSGTTTLGRFRLWNVETFRESRYPSIPRTTFKGYVIELAARREKARLKVHPIPEVKNRIIPPNISRMEAKNSNSPVQIGASNSRELRAVWRNREDEIDPDWVREKILQTNELFVDGSEFEAVWFDKENTYVIIRDPTPPFVIGSIWKNRDRLYQRLDEIEGEFLVPQKLAEIWLQF